MNARSNTECWTTLTCYRTIDTAHISYPSNWAVRVVETKEEYFCYPTSFCSYLPKNFMYLTIDNHCLYVSFT